MITVVSASDEAELVAFKAQLSNGGSLASFFKHKALALR
jgi:hypothetical protein